MKQILPRLLFLFILVITFFEASATHNRAGEIRVEQIGDDCNSLMVKVTATIYTKASSTTADRDSVTICWGDGVGEEFCEEIPRVNGGGEGVRLQNDIKQSVYCGFHTYAGRGRYTISMTDPNRIANIININGGTSVMVPFYIETVYSFLDPQFQGCNSTPILLQPPIDIGCIGQQFRHNPNAYDPDGDSLSYQMIVPLQGADEPVPGYQFPQQVPPGGFLDINEVTGDLIWTSPAKKGDYNIAIMIIEHRNGAPIDTTIRDLQIEIVECNNMPPEIEVIREICVVAGETLEFDVIARAPAEESDQKVAIEAFGGPFVIRDSAVFNVAGGFQPQPLLGKFRWETKCEHISDQYYSVVFRAEDNFAIIRNGGADTSFLSTLETVRIKVVAPAPEDLQAEALQGKVDLTWFSPYVCEDAREDYFYGFAVYRRLGAGNVQIDTCNPGLNGGYQRIATRTQDLNMDGRYTFSDTNVERGRTYCYRVLARFAKYTDNNQPYNIVDGLPSDKACETLSRDIPLITNVSVEKTDAGDGHVFVQWSKPNEADLNPAQNPPPYRYRLLRAPGITDTGFQPVSGADFTATTFAMANDTNFLDTTGLNTAAEQYSYKVEFYVNGENEPLGDTEVASSIFLNIYETDERNELSWQFKVPWGNTEYTIFRDDDADGVFDSLATTQDTVFVDTDLVNGKEYCYFIESTGTYGVAGLLEPLLNKSQRDCGVPVDNVPPCPPPLVINNICDPEPDQELIDDVENRLRWMNPETICEETDDVFGYRIYYASDSLSTLELIASIDFEDDTTYYHSTEFGLAGCYAVTAFDSLNNESLFSNIVCRDNCPLYELPNAFTPNGDSQNDFFIPYPYRFVASVDLQIVNRWGNVVFETTDPAISWDGTSPGGEDLPDGVYFYKCQVFEQRLDGVVPSEVVLSGYIELIRATR